ncbi:winged helix-turn-helix transcriptional regulator [Streptomyces sp. 8L]|uniref:winged helix-turn-helix transcriptional regulator n=1 Tax=Streptomyces sp. 8L TaxID=2877242 RepID=UPI001CD65EB7|nr:helix-turn-helix domain-containing protein [Streptomyces sp. 8L]MCA1221692.1 helix-turn-helix transcriptional regulator [Streptomyces sp. 8L]
MEVISGKWKVVILWAPGEQIHCFCELRRLIPDVSEKVLSRAPQGTGEGRARELEKNGIARRDVFDERPVLRVEYSLTGRGSARNAALKPLGARGREYLPERAVPIPVGDEGLGART